jgi:glucose-1-phosphatase
VYSLLFSCTGFFLRFAGLSLRGLSMTNSTIKNIIFDFGGVLFNIDHALTRKAFESLGLQGGLHVSLTAQSKLFDELETGQLSEQEFFAELRKAAGKEIPDEALRDAWNALLLDLPPERFELLRELGKRYNLYLLSNTNIIHSTAFLRMIDELLGEGTWPAAFKKIYYSHEIGMRKPGKEIYEFVLKDAGIRAEETLFIDDSPANLEAPGELGIKVMLADKPVTELLKTF